MRQKLPFIRWASLAVGINLLLAIDVSADTVVPVAGPFVEQVSPPAVCRGRTNRIELIGRELDEALDLWTSVPGVKFKATLREQSDSRHAWFDVEVPPNAPLGIYGLRIATRSGLSNTHLFLIDELPIQTRASSASDSSETVPMNVALPTAIHGNCRAAAVDRYQIRVKPGQSVTFEAVGNRFGKDYDPLVTIRDSRGRVVAERDNDVGLFFDCRFQHTFAVGGAYFVDVRDARFAGDPSWHYVLRMGDFPAARVAVPSSVTPGEPSQLQLPQVPGAKVQVKLPADAPLGWFYQEVRLTPQGLATWLPLQVDHDENQRESEPNEDRDAGTETTLPATLHGVLAQAGDHDWFKLEMKQGKLMTFQSEARGLGSPADLELVLFNQDGREVRRSDDVVVREGTDQWSVDARFDFSAAKDGPHYLCVRDMAGDGGPAFAYRVEVNRGDPKLQLKSAVARVTLPRETFQSIPLKVTRTHFAGPIDLKLIGAPEGVELEPTTIPSDVTEMVCRLKADRATPQGLATIQILGRWESDDPENKPSASAVAEAFPLIDCRIKDKDLRILALRDDQIHLPPSLTNSLAVLVTPPAPFDVKLPEAELLITKYVDGSFPIVTTRKPDFASPITFAAQGGQIGPQAEERSNIFLRFPSATPDKLQVAGLVFNRILTGYGKFRVDLTATAREDLRRVTLHRTFDLEVKSAFSPTPEANALEIEPGETAKFRILADRTPAFEGVVTLTTTPLVGFEHPETLEIAAGQPHADIEVKASPETAPGRYQLRFASRGYVGKYEEAVNGPNLTITVKKPVEKKQ